MQTLIEAVNALIEFRNAKAFEPVPESLWDDLCAAAGRYKPDDGSTGINFVRGDFESYEYTCDENNEGVALGTMTDAEWAVAEQRCDKLIGYSTTAWEILWDCVGEVCKEVAAGRIEISTEVHTDDHVFEHTFNAAMWFSLATDEQILDLAACDWRCDYPADAVAESEADRDEKLAWMFKYLEFYNAGIRNSIGYEVLVNGVHAMDWLDAHRPHLSKIIREAKS